MSRRKHEVLVELERANAQLRETRRHLTRLVAAARSYREVAEHPGGHIDTIQDLARDELDAALAEASS